MARDSAFIAPVYREVGSASVFSLSPCCRFYGPKMSDSQRRSAPSSWAPMPTSPASQAPASCRPSLRLGRDVPTFRKPRRTIRVRLRFLQAPGPQALGTSHPPESLILGRYYLMPVVSGRRRSLGMTAVARRHGAFNPCDSAPRRLVVFAPDLVHVDRRFGVLWIHIP